MSLSPKVIALTQQHRGHGVSTATFFLGRVLTQSHYPTLLADLTPRHQRLQFLNEHFATRRLVLWVPPPAGLRDLPTLLRQARAQVQGKASAILLDCDNILLHGQITANDTSSIDYLIVATEYTLEGTKAAEEVAEHFEALYTRRRIGIVYTRVNLNAVEIEDIPSETDGGYPVLGAWPADYRLANSEEDSAIIAEPHEPYLSRIAQIATRLSRLVGMQAAE
jgi:hypothetical protein